jgi:hypothetical protein
MLSCLTQVRSIGQATHMYQADNTQYYDYGLDSRGGTNLFHNDTLNKYLGLGNLWTDTRAADVWHCPEVFDEARRARDDQWTVYTTNANLSGWVVDATGYNYSGTSYSPYASGLQNVKEADIKEPPSNTAMHQEGYLPTGWVTPTSHSIRSNGGANFLAPHFSNSNYTWGGQLGANPTHPDEVAGAGKCSVVFMDGGAGNYVALDFPGGSGNASYQLER